MRTDSPPTGSVPNRKKGIWIWFIIAGACLVLGILTIITSKKPESEPNFVWLDPTQFSLQMRPGRLKRFYYKLVNFTAPVWKRFSRPKTHLQISISTYAAHGISMGELGVGAAIGTNLTRTQAWLLSASELEQLQERLEDLRQRLSTFNRVDRVNSSAMTLADGTSAAVMDGQSFLGISTFVGVRVDLTPKIASHQFHLATSALYSEPIQSSTSIQTNLSAACRVTLPSAGAVLISSPVSRDVNGTNYWLILSPTAVDGYGKPIKL